ARHAGTASLASTSSNGSSTAVIGALVAPRHYVCVDATSRPRDSAACDAAHVLPHRLSLLDELGERFCELGRRILRSLEHPCEPDLQRDDAVLRAVVQLALHPATLACRGLGRTRVRLQQLTGQRAYLRL